MPYVEPYYFIQAVLNIVGGLAATQISALTITAGSTPSTPASDSSVFYMTAVGTTPNRVVSLCEKMEDGTEFVISAIVV